MKEILEDALQRGLVKAAESYLQLKPWVYGAVTTNMVISTCIDIARQKETENSKAEILMNMVCFYLMLDFFFRKKMYRQFI